MPVGLVNSSWGGTRIEPWTPPCGFAGIKELAEILKQVELTNPANAAYKAKLGAYIQGLEKWLTEAKTALKAEAPLTPSPAYPADIQPLTSHQSPTTLYNGMIHPLVPFAMRGAIWYQGESNHSEGMLYYHKMRALIDGWRKVWNQGEFPFLYVQSLPTNTVANPPSILPIFWEAQNKCLDIPNTAKSSFTISETCKTSIRPTSRMWAPALPRSRWPRPTDVRGSSTSGPTFKSLAVEGDKLRITFDHVGSGLVSSDGKPLNWFEIIGQETDFVPAKAVIDATRWSLGS